MKIFFSILFAICFLYSYGQENKDEFTSFITSKIDSMPNGFANSVALIKDGEVINIGILKENDQFVLQDFKDSLFEIGSLTKVFTSTLLADEVLNRKLKLTKTVNKAFPYPFNNKIKITYQSLANHTSGMYRLPGNMMPFLFSNPDNPYSKYTYELFDEYLKEELQLEKAEKPEYNYSNLGAGLLAYALSNINGKKI